MVFGMYSNDYIRYKSAATMASRVSLMCGAAAWAKDFAEVEVELVDVVVVEVEPVVFAVVWVLVFVDGAV